MKEERESGVWREAGALQAWKSTEFRNCWAMKETCTVNPNLELTIFPSESANYNKTTTPPQSDEDQIEHSSEEVIIPHINNPEWSLVVPE